ncbi:MAG: type IV pilus assembly protein PilM [Solirubrobacteraceae bacterium]
MQRARKVARQPRGGRGTTLVGLDIEPGLIVAAKSHLNGGLVVDHAAFLPIDIEIVRDGEVQDVPALVTALAELFKGSGLDRRVRIGIANQRILMRRIELPPLTDPSEIAQAVQFQARDEIPMPLETVVVDYHTLGIVEREGGPRLQVLLVAARRDMVERVLHAARLAGLQPEGVDLAAFGMVRALHPVDAAEHERILYLAIGGLTNIAIADGLTCEFTRVIPFGVEQIASDVASRCAIPVDAARQILITMPIASPVPDQPRIPELESAPTTELATSHDDAVSGADNVAVAREALDDGIRRIGSEVRNSLDFYLAAQDASAVARAVLTGPALEIPGFDRALSRQLGIAVERGVVASGVIDVPASILPVAAGLSVVEGVQ